MNIINLLLNKHLYLHESLYRTVTLIPNLTHRSEPLPVNRSAQVYTISVPPSTWTHKKQLTYILVMPMRGQCVNFLANIRGHVVHEYIQEAHSIPHMMQNMLTLL